MIVEQKETKLITPPLTDEDVAKLRAGDKVLISGSVFTARDAAHKRLCDLIKEGKPLPIDLKGQIIYYVGPTPAKPGYIIGSAGPTTASRMDSTTVPLLERGLKGTIGKGGRTEELAQQFAKYKAVHIAAIGGAGAYLAKQIKSICVVAYEDLGTEAIHQLELNEFPCVVINDIYGVDFYKVTQSQWRR